MATASAPRREWSGGREEPDALDPPLPMPVARPALTKREPKKGERRVLIRAWAVAVLAVHDLRLVRVQSQTRPQPSCQRSPAARAAPDVRSCSAPRRRRRSVQTAPKG